MSGVSAEALWGGVYEVYRFHNTDGTSKDWAIRDNRDGTYTKRWGKTSTKLQAKIFPLNNQGNIWREERAKLDKGYKSVGKFYIDEDGKLLTPRPSSLTPTKEEPRIYWRIRINETMADVPSKEFFRGSARSWGQTLLGYYPSCEWLVAFISRYRLMSSVKSEAGFFQKEDGVGPLLLFMALQKSAPKGIAVSLAHDDEVEISGRLKLEAQALSFFGTDLEAVRPIAETIGLLDKRFDLSEVAPDLADFYF